ncbi:MAG TPA: tetratricopeptide repeat protein [Chthonomonadaceae bacterium]|nr:tetratricopeptide repeat protein [Chthonomonadaceae bacterium]
MESQQGISFSDWLVQRMLSYRTVHLYERRVKQFVAFAAQGDHKVVEAARDAVAWDRMRHRFLLALQGDQTLSESSLKQIKGALRCYRDYLQDANKPEEPHPTASSLLGAPCRIELFGGLRVETGDRAFSRFSSGKTRALLGYLALFRHHPHAREALIDQFWPEATLEVGRNRLKQCLCSLRRQLEPPGTRYGSVLAADRTEVSLHRERVSTDVCDFEAALQAAGRTSGAEERLEGLERAIVLYRGELLPRWEEPWTVGERERLAQFYLDALRQMTATTELTGDLEKALTFARRAVDAAPLSEERHCEVMRLLAELGDPSALMQQYRTLKRLLSAHLDAAPTQTTREAVKRYRKRAREVAQELACKQPTPPPETELETPPRVTPEEVLQPRLPLSLSRFFGREREIAHLTEWLRSEEIRLVTLTGPGGCGKTRLAVETARHSADAFAGAVWFAALADLTDARLIPLRLAETLSLRRADTASPLEQVVEALARRRNLLVLDNFEHLIEDGVRILRDLLERAPGLTCLVTSRQRLELAGEREYVLGPLPVPEEDDSPEQLSAVSSAQLFRDRAQALRPDFQITPRNAATVASLCRELEGLPLAIELAAAWIRTLTPQQMLERLQDRFRLLASQSREIEPRHRTLRATLDSSYRLLIPELQRFFAQLSVFRGGWTLEAAEQVCATPEAWEYLDELVKRSLVRTVETEDGREMRFRMLETLREYAREQQTPEECSLAAERHLDYFLGFARNAARELNGQYAGEWLDRLEREQDNLRAALQWALTVASPEKGLMLAGSLWRFWCVRGDAEEGLTWIQEHLKRCEAVDVRLRIQALHGAGNIAYSRSDYAAARGFFEAALTLRDPLAEPVGFALSLGSLANIAREEQNYALAQDLLEQSLEIFRQAGDTRGISVTLANLALVASRQEDYARACDLHRESLELFRATGDLPNLARALNNLVNTLTTMGDASQALGLAGESLAQNEALGNKRGIVQSLTNIANLMSALERYHASAILIGAIDAVRAQEGLPRPSNADAEHRSLLERLRTQLGEATLSAAYTEGGAMTMEEMLTYTQQALNR